jgi:hypothetical protein
VNPRGPHWDNPTDILAWLGQLRDVLLDMAVAAEDVTRPEDDRTLGRIAARETILASRQMASEMLDLGMSSLLAKKGRMDLN